MNKRIKNLQRMNKEQIIRSYGRLYLENQLLKDYKYMKDTEIDGLYDFLEENGFTPGDVIEYFQKRNLLDDSVSPESFTKITADNTELLNDCIIDLMGNSYQKRVLYTFENMICIHSYGHSKFNEILDKHGIRITNTHGFKEYWIRDYVEKQK